MTLPDAFVSYTRPLMGDARYEQFARALDSEPPVNIRLNPLKLNGRTPPSATPVPWCHNGWYLSTRPAFTFDPLFHAGAYYVQEASSMFVSEVIRQFITRPALVLDLCAAPGGKSTAIRAALPQGSILVANEPVRLRANVLAENMQKWGQPEVMVTNNYPRDFRKSHLLFDAVFADMPCSGEGMFRKDPNAITDWSETKVAQCQALQRSIAEDIWPCLKPGGLMVYSTCTFNAHEDEENVAWIADTLGAECLTLQTPSDWHITGALTGSLPVSRFIPGFTRGEGLFMAVLRKNGDASATADETASERKEKRKHDRRKVQGKGNDLPDLQAFAHSFPSDFCFSFNGSTLMAMPAALQAVYEKAAPSLHVLHAGVAVATLKGKTLLPHTSLALTTALNREAFPVVNLDFAQAVSYLRCEALTLPASTPKGFTLVSYQGLPLGFVKNIGTRANNLYPQEWKIKSGHIPDRQLTEVL